MGKAQPIDRKPSLGIKQVALSGFDQSQLCYGLSFRGKFPGMSTIAIKKLLLSIYVCR